jgi:AraC family transcriptional regulator of arabinose operon
MYTLAGQGIVHAGTEILECTAGFITIVPPGTPQDYYTPEGQIWEKQWAHFIPRVSWIDWLPVENASGPICNFYIKDPVNQTLIESGFNRLLRYSRDNLLRHREELILNALEEIILLLSGQLNDQKKLDPRIKEVLTILSQHYDEEHQIEQLAQQVCLSPSRMSHLFKEQVGDSIIETLTKLRLKQAEKLLLYTSRRITEIAMDVGFNSPDYFTRQFALYYGLNPSEFRKQDKRETAR